MLAWAAFALPSLAQTTAEGVVVVAPSPLQGAGIDADKLPGTVETIGAADFVRQDSLAVVDAISQHTPGASMADTQGNPFTQDFNFRGFEASPLQGTPEGLAVYMGGVRLNESFGDTVNWDLIPETAVRRTDLYTNNPAFGLNALGGAVNLEMKNGFNSPGGSITVQGGSFGRVFGSGEYGVTSGPWALYVAAEGGHDDGWRLHSPSSVARFYGDLGWKDDKGEAHLILSSGQSVLGVVGPTPVDMVNADRKSVYTFPQSTRNNTQLMALNGRYDIGGGWSLQGDAYARIFSQHHVDGNDGNFEGCSRSATSPLFGTLCVEDDDFPASIRPAAGAFQVLGPNNAPIGCPPLVAGQTKLCNGIPYGSLDRTRTNSDTYGVAGQATNDSALWGHANLFTIGASYDQGRARFSANSTLGLIFPDLHVGPEAAIPGMGQIIHTAGNIAYSPVEVRTTTRYTGLYASDTFDLLPNLSATLSGRANLARVGMTDLTGVTPDLNGEHEYDRFNPGAGLAWRAIPGLTLYGGYSEANRVPTALELGCSDPLKPCLLENALVADPPLKQVVARSWEGGLRGSLPVEGGRLGWRFTGYRTDSDDDIVALPSVIQGRGSYANVPKTRRQGLEAKLDYARPGFSAYVAYGYVDATYRFSGPLPSPNSPFADSVGNVQVAPGDRIGGVPSQRFKAGADVTVWRGFAIGADVLAVGSQYYVGDEANEDAKLPSYWTVNLRGEYRVLPNLTLFARVDNLFDKDYATYGTYFETDALENVHPSPLPDNADPHTITPAQPRSFMLGLTARW